MTKIRIRVTPVDGTDRPLASAFEQDFEPPPPPGGTTGAGEFIEISFPSDNDPPTGPTRRIVIRTRDDGPPELKLWRIS